MSYIKVSRLIVSFMALATAFALVYYGWEYTALVFAYISGEQMTKWGDGK